MTKRLRTILAVGSTATLASVLVFLFWAQDWKYLQPTPKPANLAQLPVGAVVPLKFLSAFPGRPVMLHFFNPDCPCSRFNKPHVRALFDAWKDRVDFVVVAEREIDDQEDPLGGEAPVVTDETGEVASAAGVYSTPQAVLLDSQHRLFFRGNYNSSRYCTDEKTQYARLALEALAAQEKMISGEDATRSWGCQLPTALSRSSP